MQVGAADPRELDVEDDLAVGRLRLGRVLVADVALAVPDERLHRREHPPAAPKAGLPAVAQGLNAVHDHVRDAVGELVRLERRPALGERLRVEGDDVGEAAPGARTPRPWQARGGRPAGR